VNFYFSSIKLSRAKEDDVCVRLDMELSREDLTEEIREKLTLEKSMHIGAAIDQRRAMPNFIKLFVEKLDISQVLLYIILEDCIDSSLDEVTTKKLDLNKVPASKVLIQAKYFE
jgi:hypothetical protein